LPTLANDSAFHPAAEPWLSVVIPAYNEERRLGATLESVLAFLRGKGEPFEVLVVDDGSRDGTAELARGHGVTVISLPANRGKGAALKAGALASRGRRVLLIDADGSTPINEVDRLVPRLAEASVVVGSRALASSQIAVHQPFYRRFLGKGFNAVLRVLGLTEFRDTQCGFKLLDGPLARRLFAELTVERFAYDVELLLLARRHGERVAEVGVAWADDASSRVHPVLDSSQMLWDVLRLSWRHRRRRGGA